MEIKKEKTTQSKPNILLTLAIQIFKYHYPFFFNSKQNLFLIKLIHGLALHLSLLLLSALLISINKLLNCQNDDLLSNISKTKEDIMSKSNFPFSGTKVLCPLKEVSQRFYRGTYFSVLPYCSTCKVFHSLVPPSATFLVSKSYHNINSTHFCATFERIQGYLGSLCLLLLREYGD